MKSNVIPLLTIGLISFLQACQPQQAADTAQRQHQFVCQSLIEGFLKAGRQGSYRLHQIQQHTVDHQNLTYYQYRSSSDDHIRLNHPSRQDLTFQCHQSQANHFQLFLLDDLKKPVYSVLSLNLPDDQHWKKLTAYHW